MITKSWQMIIEHLLYARRCSRNRGYPMTEIWLLTCSKLNCLEPLEKAPRGSFPGTWLGGGVWKKQRHVSQCNRLKVGKAWKAVVLRDSWLSLCSRRTEACMTLGVPGDKDAKLGWNRIVTRPYYNFLNPRITEIFNLKIIKMPLFF